MPFCQCGCGATVTNLYRRGHQFRRDPQERFWEKVIKTDTCWLWTAGTDSGGYGTFRLGERTVGAHRVAYEWLVGPIPEGLTLDHVRARGCTNRNCVNPAHLEPVTHRENTLRGEAPAAKQARRDHCKRGHPLSGDNLYVDSRGGRGCRTCIRETKRAPGDHPYPLYWRVRAVMPEWFGRRCRIVIHGGGANKMGTRLIEFEDGHRAIAPGSYLRRVPLA